MKQLNEKTLAQLCLASSRKYGNRPALAMLSNGEICRNVTYRELEIRARQLGLLLRQMGVAKGDRVLLLSENCPEWVISYFGIAFAGAVSVPLLTGFSGDQIGQIAAHAQISAICLSQNAAQKIENS